MCSLRIEHFPSCFYFPRKKRTFNKISKTKLPLSLTPVPAIRIIIIRSSVLWCNDIAWRFIICLLFAWRYGKLLPTFLGSCPGFKVVVFGELTIELSATRYKWFFSVCNMIVPRAGGVIVVGRCHSKNRLGFKRWCAMKLTHDKVCAVALYLTRCICTSKRIRKIFRVHNCADLRITWL